jgi:hypothetical protein
MMFPPWQGRPFVSFGYHLKGLNCNALKCAPLPESEPSGPHHNPVSGGTFQILGDCSFDSSGEAVMKRITTIAAACLAVALAASSPALARGGFHGGGGHFGGRGIGPGIAAGIVAGAVIGGAGYYGGGYGPGYGYAPGAYDDSYAYDAPTAYDNGSYGGYDNGYGARNGYACQPGTWFRGEDGRRHLCQ